MPKHTYAFYLYAMHTLYILILYRKYDLLHRQVPGRYKHDHLIHDQAIRCKSEHPDVPHAVS